MLSGDSSVADRYSADHLTDAALLNETAPFALGERSNLVQLLVRIAEIDRRKLYLRAGHDSMFTYCMEEFRLTEDEALKRIHVARTAREFPPLFEALDQGLVCLSRVRMLATHLTPENADDLVEAAKAYRQLSEFRRFLARYTAPSLLSAAEADSSQAVSSWEGADSQARGPVTEPSAEDSPTPASPPSGGQPHDSGVLTELAELQARGPVTAPLEESEWVELRVKVRRSKLQYARELLSHSVPSGSATLILDHALSVAIERAEKRKFAACSKPRAPRARSQRDRMIPAHVRRAVWERDGGKCTFVSEGGRRCSSRRRIEYDHVRPVARGGKTSVENLRLRCHGHNQYEAEQAFGAEFMKKKRERAQARRAGTVHAVANALPLGERFRDDVIAGLRSLGVKAGEARQIVERSDALQQTTLEESMRSALRCSRRGARSG